MPRLYAIVAALLLPAAHSFLVGSAIALGTLIISQPSARAGLQSAEAVAKVAQSITVRIEGATQGSGVLVKRDGSRYTVLTAWHVVKAQKPGEELDIYTPDGLRHQLEQGSIKHLGEVDLAVLSFMSSNIYGLAEVGDVKSVSMGSPLFVGGFPLPSSAVPTRLLRFLKGEVIANATVAIPNGYQLLYSNPTLPGMSGGAVMNDKGKLIGIHANAERADQISEKSGKAVATGTNQAVPIAYYSKYAMGVAFSTSSGKPSSADDYLAQAAFILSRGLPMGEGGLRGDFLAVIELTNKALAISSNVAGAYALRARARVGIGAYSLAIADADKAIILAPRNINAFFARATVKTALGDRQGAIMDYDEVLAIDPQYAFAYFNRANAKAALGDRQGAIADYSKGLAINPQFAGAFSNRGLAKFALGDKQGAIEDCNQAVAVNPHDAKVYSVRAFVKSELGDKQGAIADYNQAIAINPHDAGGYVGRGVVRSGLGEKQGAIADYSQAIAINPQDAKVYSIRGFAKSELGDKQGAIADYSQAIAVDPQFASAYVNRGNRRFELGDVQGAISDYSRAMVVNPQLADAYSNRGNVFLSLGDIGRACGDLRVAAGLGSVDAAFELRRRCQ